MSNRGLKILEWVILLSLLIVIMILLMLGLPLIANAKQPRLERWINHHLDRIGYRTVAIRRIRAKRLSTRIVAESKRFRLDPIALTTIAWIESDYRTTRRGTYGGHGSSRNERGVWQLIPVGWAVRRSARLLWGCPVAKHVPVWRRRGWPRGKSCVAPDVGARRTSTGYFTPLELRDVYISTWVAAFEIAGHVAACKRKSPNGHNWSTPLWLTQWQRANPNVNRTRLERYLHYNWGAKQIPGSRYRRKFFQRYAVVRRFVRGAK